MTIELKPHERLDRLERENIDIIQSSEVFSFSIDAVLLSDFATIPHVQEMESSAFYSVLKQKIKLSALNYKTHYVIWQIEPFNSIN